MAVGSRSLTAYEFVRGKAWEVDPTAEHLSRTHLVDRTGAVPSGREAHLLSYTGGMSSYAVRTYGDPVLRQVAKPIDDVDGALVKLVDDMVETMYEAVGAGLAAPQVGVQRRLFVYELDDGPKAIINPEIVESSGELYHDEACLSIPGLRIGIIRPETVLLKGFDLDGNELSIEADDFMGRMFQHEVDHLNGVLMVERLDDDMRKQALRILRDRAMGLDTSAMEAKLVSAGSDREV